ncbi:MAG: hypothetical protein EAZ35_02920 [Sphingobacteriia bacterium]|nr:MAG: hypothetical protein EAZ41_06130 [Sphingobacteriia bacterium]TAG31622.1 MAG: hypothetical protein EAZ35_02920 [Sphingobacteriia bacterium]
MAQKLPWKKILVTTLWLLIVIGTMVLTGAAMHQKNNKKCAGVNIAIVGAEKHMFIDETDVLAMLNMGGNIIGQPVQRLKLRKMESMMKQNVWVKNAEMFFDNLQVLQVSIEEREPVARLFQVNGASFYIDTALSFLPLSTKLSARVPVFTNLPIQKQKDSLLLKQIIEMAAYINADSFFTAQISQINISAENHFEIVPLIGDHIVYFGDASDIRAKFKKLNAFYRSAWLERGIYTYEKLDIQYKNQVIGIKKGTAQMYADSAAAIKLMQIIDTTKLDTIPKILLPLNNKQNPIPLTSKRNTL